MVDGRRSTKKRAVDANRLIYDESWQDVIMTDLSRPSSTARRGRRAQLRPPLPTSPIVGEEFYFFPLQLGEGFVFIPSPRLGEGEQSSGEVRFWAQVLKKDTREVYSVNDFMDFNDFSGASRPRRLMVDG